MPLQFFDETGVNYAAAGAQVSVYPASGAQTAATLVGSAFISVGGYAAINVTQGVNYIAVFTGFRGPQQPQAFTGGTVDTTTQVVCLPYRSASLSLVGYTQEMANVLPTGPGWYSDAAKAPGGIAWATLAGGAALLYQLDSQTQVAIEMMRLQSCVGSDVDTWQADFLNGYLPRYYLESDPLYIARIIAFLSSEKVTLAGIQFVVNAFFASTAGQLAAQYAQNITFDGQGSYDGQGGYDTGQGYAPAIPDVLVWDKMSQPALAAEFDINEPEFVISIGYNPPGSSAWFLNHSHLNFDTYLIAADRYALSRTAPDPRLAALVNLVKGAGFVPVYLTFLESV